MQEFLNRFDDKFEEKLIERINQYDAMDLLAKASNGSFFLRTSLFENDCRTNEVISLDKCTIYLTSLFITKGMNQNGKIITCDELIDLSNDISMLMLVKNHMSGEEIMAVTMCQNSKSEVLEKFKWYSVVTLLKHEADLLKDDGIPYHSFIEDIMNFVENMYNVEMSVEGKSFDEYINNFNKYNKSNFCYKGKYKSVFEKFSAFNGQRPDLYNPNAPFYSLEILRCCFLKQDDNLMCFIPELITTNLLKYFPHYYSSDKKIKWYDKRTTWSENSVANIFSIYFKGAIIYSNNYFYLNRSKNRHENDLLIDYKGFLFIIEVKAGRVSPDPIYENTDNVLESYKTQVSKGIKQCNALEKTLIESGNLEIFNEDNQSKVKLKYSDYEEIFKIVVTFEEMGSFLPGYLIRENQQKGHYVVNFFDLYVVLDYLANPALIIRYFQERKQPLIQQCNIYDELVFLGIFTSITMNYSSYLRNIYEETQSEGKNISTMYLPEIEFMSQIEAYYTRKNSIKPKFEINNLVMRLIDVNFSNISKIEMSHLILLLDMSADRHQDIEEKHKYSNLVIRSERKDGKAKYTLVIKKTKNDCYRICANYFRSHTDLEYIVIIYFEGYRTKITTVKRNNQLLKKYLSDMGEWRRTEYR